VPDPAIGSIWLDAGLVFEDVPEAAALETEGGLLETRQTGWRLLGKTRPDADAPWLDRPRRVVIRQD
jgi:hypothetical protein